MSFVKARFYLNDSYRDWLKSLIPPFGYNGFGELVFYRTYSRVKLDDSQEDWADVVARVTDGTFSIRKDWYTKNHIEWDELYWQDYAEQFAASMFKMEWLPPGRGLWAMGSNFVYERGSMALQNCGFTLLGKDLGDDIAWLMDALMCGVGVGFSPVRDDSLVVHKQVVTRELFVEDSREGWCEATRALINSFLLPGQFDPKMNYSKVRPAGVPIRGFGGTASGPEPLEKFHKQIRQFFWSLMNERNYDTVRLKADVANAAGCCVVAGNVRRSAELACLSVDDGTFLDLKDYEKYPERVAFGWMSNNSVKLERDDDFQKLGEIAKRVTKNGEPGYLNMRNFPLARIGKKMKGLKRDAACGINPCGEQPLEDKELCTLVETLPTMCKNSAHWLTACEFATFYASTVTLLPTHHSDTNKVMQRNRRIGVGIIDYSGWKHQHGLHRVIDWMREGYDLVRKVNGQLAEAAGIPPSIRVTTCKPGGTTPKLPGKTPGIGHPTFDYTLRRIRVSKNSTIHKLMSDAGIPHEEDVNDKYTDVFEYPIYQGPAKPADQVSLWEQAMNLVTVQREWSDNAVSNTLYFRPKWMLVEIIGPERKYLGKLTPIQHSAYEVMQDKLAAYVGLVTACELLVGEGSEYVVPDRYRIKVSRRDDGQAIQVLVHEYDPSHEEDVIENVLSAIAPLTKSVSLLPHSSKGAYRQMPEEGISKEEYEDRLAAIRPIDWSELSGSDGQDEKFCTSDVCEVSQ